MNNLGLEILDLSSTKPHVWNDCPLCDERWMCKVEKQGKCPNCNVPYKMKKSDNGEVNITFTIDLNDYE